MKFQYHNPIQFSFGPNVLDQLPEICRGKKVLLVYGGGSIKKNGVYDRITTLLREAGIAFGAVHDHLEDYIEGRVQSDGRHLLNIVIPTYPSTGSEANGVCDIMEYKGYGTELFGAWPDHCLMAPSVTLSPNKRSTVYSVLGCFVQTGAWFLGNQENDIAKGFAKTVLRVLLESCEALLRDPKDLRSRGNVMWASCVNTMGVFRSGVDAALEDAAIVEAGCSRLRALMEAGGVDTTLAPYGACPTMDYVKKSLAKEDYGEFTPEELHGMIAACCA